LTLDVLAETHYALQLRVIRAVRRLLGRNPSGETPEYHAPQTQAIDLRNPFWTRGRWIAVIEALNPESLGDHDKVADGKW